MIDDMPPENDLLYDAWVLLANGAYWDHTDPTRTTEWEAARTRWRDRWHETLPPTPENVECPHCDGMGHEAQKPCPECDGTGWVGPS